MNTAIDVKYESTAIIVCWKKIYQNYMNTWQLGKTHLYLTLCPLSRGSIYALDFYKPICRIDVPNIFCELVKRTAQKPVNDNIASDNDLLLLPGSQRPYGVTEPQSINNGMGHNIDTWPFADSNVFWWTSNIRQGTKCSSSSAPSWRACVGH